MKVLDFSIILTSFIVFGFLLSSQSSFEASNPYLGCPDCNDTSNIQQTSQQQVQLTSGGSLQVGFSTDPINPNTTDQTQLKINFMNKQNSQQQHIDYKISIMQAGNQVFGIPVTHTAEGAVTIPFQFQTVGTYQMTVEVEGILFQPIPPETAVFNINVGGTASTQSTSMPSSTTSTPTTSSSTTASSPTSTASSSTTASSPTPTTATTIQSTNSATSAKIPHWVKTLFGLYGQGQVSDDDLISALRFLIQTDVIRVS